MPSKQPSRRPWQPTQKSGYEKVSTYQPKKVRDPFYLTPTWKATRLRQLQEEPFCRACDKLGLITPATVVDHDKPRRLGGAEYDRDNLQSLCTSCHNRKSRYENNLTYPENEK